LGLLTGVYQPGDDPIRGTLILEDGTKVNAVLIRTLRKKVKINPDFIATISNSLRLWRIYPKTLTNGRLCRVDLLSSKAVDEQSTPQINLITIKGIAVQLDKESNRPRMGIMIQRESRGVDNFKPTSFTLVVNGNIPEYCANQFWAIQATVDRGYLYYHDGECLQLEYDPETAQKDLAKTNNNQVNPPKSSKSQTLKESSANESNGTTPTSSSIQTTKESSSGEIIMLSGRIPELTVKFDTRPDCPETGKKVTLQISGENGITVRATLNRKTLKKQVEKMDSLEQWVGALSGKMSKIADDGVIELEGVGLTVFEKKTKNKTQSESSPQPEI